MKYLITFLFTVSFYLVQAQSGYTSAYYHPYSPSAGYTPPAKPTPYTAPSYYKPSYTPSYTKPSYNSNTPSYTPSRNTYTPSTTNTPSPSYTPATNSEIKSYVTARQWLNDHVDEVTESEKEESLKTAKELLKLILSAGNNFDGYRGGYIDSTSKYLMYHVINTDFLKCNDENIERFNGNIHYFGHFRFNEKTKANIRNIYLALIKQIPLLTRETGSKLYIRVMDANEDISNDYTYFLNDLSSNKTVCSLTVNKEKGDLKIMISGH